MASVALPSIRRRLTASLLWISLFFGVLTAAVVWFVLGHEVNELMDQELRETAEITHNLMASQPEHMWFNPDRLQHDEYEEHLVWQVVDVGTGAVKSRSHQAPEQALLTQITSTITPTPDGRWHAVTFGFKHQPQYFLLVAQSKAEREESRLEAVVFTFLAAFGMSLMSTLLMNWRIRQELRPLGALGRSVQCYDPLQPDSAPQGVPREELRPIEQAIKELGQRLAQRVISERAFSSHAAHALRTPVAGLDIQLAMAIKEVPDTFKPRLIRARQATARLGRVMQALLMMFRSGIEPVCQAVTLDQLLGSLTFNDLQVEIVSGTTIQVDPDLMAAVLLNLLDNAQRFQARTVWISAEHQNGQCCLRLQDDGQGCSANKLAGLRTALERQDYAPGSELKGLGLILADLVTRAHGGRVSLPAVSAGFCVQLCWPDSGPRRLRAL